MSKKCINCGAELHDQAAFCHACATIQEEKHSSAAPKPGKKKKLSALLALVLGIVIIISLALIATKTVKEPSEPTPPASSTAEPAEAVYEPQVFETEDAEILYRIGECTYRITATFALRTADQNFALPTAYAEMPAAEGVNFATHSQLFVQSEDMSGFLNEEFSLLVKEVRLSGEAQDGGIDIVPGLVTGNPDDPMAFAYSMMPLSTKVGTNLLTWEIEMLNGDIIRLHQTISVPVRALASYYFYDYPMDTIEDLKATLDSITAELDPSIEASIYLPPVVYEDGLDLSERSFNFYGCTNIETGQQTTFKGTLTLRSNSPTIPEIRGIVFDGEGSREGMHILTASYITECVFLNCSTGTYSGKNSWPLVWGCRYEGCMVGIDINNPGFANKMSSNFGNTIFSDNDTAFLLSACGFPDALSFGGCTFAGNGENVVNMCENAIDLSGATIE